MQTQLHMYITQSDIQTLTHACSLAVSESPELIAIASTSSINKHLTLFTGSVVEDPPQPTSTWAWGYIQRADIGSTICCCRECCSEKMHLIFSFHFKKCVVL